MKAFILALALLCIAGTCESQMWVASGTPSTFQPAGAVQVTPDSVWLNGYAQAEKCVGLEGDVAAVTWFVVPGRSFKDTEGNEDIGLWVEPHSIFIAGDYKNFEWVATHESLHDLLRSGVHPKEVFGTLCHAMWGYLQ
ncbi:MAG TPA: hypothetical protein VIU40_02790 [Geobacteraceae bacterium]